MSKHGIIAGPDGRGCVRGPGDAHRPAVLLPHLNITDDRTLVVNFFGGPSTGKSTMMAHVFALLKWDGVNAEMAPEFAKEVVWEERLRILKEEQVYLLGKQFHRLQRLQQKVDVVLTDCPLLMSKVYATDMASAESWGRTVDWHHNEFRNLNVWLTREKAYQPAGRVQTEGEARALDAPIREALESAAGLHGVISFAAIPASAPQIHDVIRGKLEREGSLSGRRTSR